MLGETIVTDIILILLEYDDEKAQEPTVLALMLGCCS